MTITVTFAHDLQYITWISDNKVAWTLNVAGMAADSAVQISARPVPQEPMVCPNHPYWLDKHANTYQTIVHYS